MRFDHVILTEKPSVAKDVAAALGAASAGSRGEWYESGRIAITWSFGHLLEAFEPHDYNPAWQEWKLGLLPVIPANFAFRYKPRSREARQRLRIIGELAQQANTLVDACDAGREGELIFREIIDHVKFPAEKTERMWLNTTTRAGILAAWQARLPSNTAKHENLAKAARLRSQGDWILGTNGTRAVTVCFPKNKAPFWSVGRVQTATLALIADRDWRIAKFVPEPYYGIKMKLRGTDYGSFIDTKIVVPATMKKMGKFTKLFKEYDEAYRVKSRAMCALREPWNVKTVTKEQKVSPPALFSLTALQKICSILYQWSAQHTLDVAQQAYEQKILTYPRTDATVLPQDYVEEADKVYRLLWPLFMKGTRLNPRFPAENVRTEVFNNAKLTDHFAIVPTDVLPRLDPGGKEADTLLLWRIVVKRFLLAFSPAATLVEVQWLAGHDDPAYEEADLRSIQAVGTHHYLTGAGWIDYAKFLGQDMFEEDPDRRPFPPEEATAICQAIELYTDFTTVPDPFYEDTLLSAMEGSKLGTSATRGSTIETLFSRRYITRKGTAINATERGLFLISQLRERKLEFRTQADTTKAWETALELIEAGSGAAPTGDQFLQSIKEKTEAIICTLGGAKESLRIRVACPKTGLPVEEGPDGFVFSGFKEVKFPRVILERQMLAHEYRDILRSKNGAGPYAGFVSKRTGKAFSAMLVLKEKKQRVEFKFD